MNRVCCLSAVAGFALFFGAVLAWAVDPLHKAAVPSDVLRQVRAVLPRGWAVEVKGDEMIVRREQDVELFQFLPNTSINESAYRTVKEPCVLRFRFGPPLDAAAWLRLKGEIEKESKNLEAMREKMECSITHKFDSFLPSTPAQEKQVAEYEVAKKRLEMLSLPDYFTNDHSICRLDTSRHFATVTDKAVVEECKRVENAVTGLFRPYILRRSEARKALEAVLARTSQDKALKPKDKTAVRLEGEGADSPVVLDYNTNDSWPDIPDKMAKGGKSPGNGSVTVRVGPADWLCPTSLCLFQPPRNCGYCLEYYKTSAPNVGVSIWSMTADPEAHDRLVASVRAAMKEVGVVLNEKSEGQGARMSFFDSHRLPPDKGPPPPPLGPLRLLPRADKSSDAHGKAKVPELLPAGP